MTSSHVHGGGCTWEDDIFSCTWWRMYMRRWHFITWWRRHEKMTFYYMVEDVHEKMTSSHVHGGGCTWEDDIFSCTWWRMYMRRWHFITLWRRHEKMTFYYMVEDVHEKVTSSHVHGGGCTWEDDILLHGGGDMRRWHFITLWRMYMRRWHFITCLEETCNKVTFYYMSGGDM